MERFNLWLFLLLTIAVCICSIYFIPSLYEDTLLKSDIRQKSSTQVELDKGCPVWFYYSSVDSSYHTYKAIQESDKTYLYTLVSKEDSLYNDYCHDIDVISYRSNIESPKLNSWYFITLLFVALGCCARSLYNYIGWYCYKERQDMKRWWPWYLFRLIIVVPIASLLIVAVRTSIFSSLLTAKDLNTYLAVAFIAGFGMMEFLKMLRRVSKSLFNGEEPKKDEKSTKAESNE